MRRHTAQMSFKRQFGGVASRNQLVTVYVHSLCVREVHIRLLFDCLDDSTAFVEYLESCGPQKRSLSQSFKVGGKAYVLVFEVDTQILQDDGVRGAAASEEDRDELTKRKIYLCLYET